MQSLWDILPDDLQITIKEHKSAIKIQERIFKVFYKTYGPTWKNDINKNSLVNQLDYYCYLNKINDPWYDYSDDPKYTYN